MPFCQSKEKMARFLIISFKTLKTFKTNYIKKLTKKVYFYAIDDTKPSTYG